MGYETTYERLTPWEWLEKDASLTKAIAKVMGEEDIDDLGIEDMMERFPSLGDGITAFSGNGWTIKAADLRPIRNRLVAAGKTREDAMHQAVVEVMTSGKARINGHEPFTEEDAALVIRGSNNALEWLDQQFEEEPYSD
jgi:hypothetical protein